MRTIFNKRRIAVIIGAFALVLVISSILLCLTPFPQWDTITGNIPSKYSISKLNSFEIQSKSECSAFSAAYILRHFDREAKGSEIYKTMSYKLPASGYVLPKGLLEFFQKENLNARLFRGNIDTLKIRVSEGTPVIVLVGNHIQWQHYMTVVGYNTGLKEIYFFNSRKEYDENGEKPGNRTLSEDDFLGLWNNGLPFFNHIYFVVGE